MHIVGSDYSNQAGIRLKVAEAIFGEKIDPQTCLKFRLNTKVVAVKFIK